MTDIYSNRTLTAFFDDREEAQDAVSRLRELGIGEASIRMVGGDDSIASRESDKGFWESLGELFFPNEDRSTYAEGLRRGGFLVTVNSVPADLYDEAVDILDDEGSVDIDERAASWRSEGWKEGALTGGARDDLGSTRTETTMRGETDRLNERVSDEVDEESIPIVQEELRVGKRDTSLGRVRVRSYVVEEPVREQVNLREDRVEIERRPVDRRLTSGQGAFSEKVIEAEEHAEEAVISKDARITEEVALRKRTDERTETVSDTIRHTEVEVEDERGRLPNEKSGIRK